MAFGAVHQFQGFAGVDRVLLLVNRRLVSGVRLAAEAPVLNELARRLAGVPLRDGAFDRRARGARPRLFAPFSFFLSGTIRGRSRGFCGAEQPPNLAEALLVCGFFGRVPKTQMIEYRHPIGVPDMRIGSMREQ